MNRKSQNNRGSITVEFAVTLFLIAMLFVLLTETLIAVGRSNRYQWARYTCMAAAGAQLDSFQAVGAAVDPNDFQRLWPHVTVITEIQPGTGDWEGLHRVSVEVNRHLNGRDVHIRQSRYIALPQENKP